MTKQELFDYFEGKISKTAIYPDNGPHYQVRGKYCVLYPYDNVIDVWIVNTKDMRSGLGTRKVKNIISAVQDRAGTPFRELNGEAFGKIGDKSVILDLLRVLGIRRKKIVSGNLHTFAGLK